MMAGRLSGVAGHGKERQNDGGQNDGGTEEQSGGTPVASRGATVILPSASIASRLSHYLYHHYSAPHHSAIFFFCHMILPALGESLRGAGGRRVLVANAIAVGVVVWSVGVALLIHMLGDRWWVATIALFAPRWILSLPILAGIAGWPWLTKYVRGAVLVGVLVVFWGALGFCVPLHGWLAKPAVTYRGEPVEIVQVVLSRSQSPFPHPAAPPANLRVPPAP